MHEIFQAFDIDCEELQIKYSDANNSISANSLSKTADPSFIERKLAIEVSLLKSLTYRVQRLKMEID